MNNIAKQCFSYWNITCSREQWYVILRLNAYVIHLSPLTLAHQALDCIRPLVYHQEIADLKLSLAHVGPKNNGPHGPDHNFERFTAQGSIYSIVYGPRLQKIVNFTAQRFIVHLGHYFLGRIILKIFKTTFLKIILRYMKGLNTGILNQ